MDPEPNEETKLSDPAETRGDASASGEASTPANGVAGAARGSTDGSDASAAAAAPTPQPAPAPARKRSTRSRPNAGTHPNNVRKLRQRAMMSKAELARRAGVSPLTIDRVESGCPCRMDTKRKILEALGLQPVAATEVFPDVDLG
ncbi:MAG: helix-turn-helix transcriptional regulator [Myxococcota bacterium]